VAQVRRERVQSNKRPKERGAAAHAEGGRNRRRAAVRQRDHRHRDQGRVEKVYQSTHHVEALQRLLDPAGRPKKSKK